MRPALRCMGTALAQPCRTPERVRLGLDLVAMRHVHRQRFWTDASRRTGGHSLRRDLQRAQPSGSLAAARQASRRPGRAARVRRLHARRLRPRSEEVPDAHPDRQGGARGGIHDRVAYSCVRGDLRRTLMHDRPLPIAPHQTGGCANTATRRLRSAAPVASSVAPWSSASLRCPVRSSCGSRGARAGNRSCRRSTSCFIGHVNVVNSVHRAARVGDVEKPEWLIGRSVEHGDRKRSHQQIHTAHG